MMYDLMMGVAIDWLFVLSQDLICWLHIFFDLVHSESVAVNKVTILSECLCAWCNI